MADEIIHALKNAIQYDPKTGQFNWLEKVSARSPEAGESAGVKLKSGYWRISFRGEKYYLHRLAWMLYYNQIPPENIDHINGNKSDNRIANLRSVTQSVNMQNTKKARGKHALMGVSESRNRFRAEIRVNGEKKHLGVFDSAIDAHEAYMKAKRIYHGGHVDLKAA